jgi:hypothetical protein
VWVETHRSIDQRKAPCSRSVARSRRRAPRRSRPLFGRPARTGPVLRDDSRRPEPRRRRGTACRELGAASRAPAQRQQQTSLATKARFIPPWGRSDAVWNWLRSTGFRRSVPGSVGPDFVEPGQAPPPHHSTAPPNVKGPGVIAGRGGVRAQPRTASRQPRERGQFHTPGQGPHGGG